MAEAEKFKAEDEAALARVDARTRLESYVHRGRTLHTASVHLRRHALYISLHASFTPPLHASPHASLHRYVHRCRTLLKDKALRGRMDEDDSDAVRSALDLADEWADANANASVEELDERLAMLREQTSGVFAKYGAAADDGAESISFDDDVGEPGDHDEL
jgi:hypothetical protein